MRPGHLLLADLHLISQSEGVYVRLLLRFTALASLVLTAGSLVAQHNPDEHMSEPAAPLYERSAFAHGYLHGYEQGFHLADLDIQMGHLLPGVHIRRAEKDEDPHYRPAYGDKALFVAGFKLGMRAGYADSVGGIAFRAISEMRNAATGLAPGGASRHFDRGFYEGFLNGERHGAGDAHRDVSPAATAGACQQQHAGDNRADGQQYCDGYARGFQVGYDDGRAERRASQKSVETAENGKTP